MLLTVTWTSITKLACAECSEAELREVVLCVTPEKVDPKFCPPENTTEQPFEYHTVEATISQFYRSSSLNPPKWEYVFVYDDEQLVDGATLNSLDISGAFCKGCLSTWAEELVGNEPHLIADGDLRTFVSPHGCEYTFATGEEGEPTEPFALDWIFGDGPDGDLTVLNGEDSYLPTARNYYFENLTIDEGGLFRTVGWETDFNNVEFYQIFVSGTLTVNGVLHADGENAFTASGQSQLVDCGGSQGGRPGRTIQKILSGGNLSNEGSFGPGGGDDGGGCGGRGQSSTQAANTGADSFYLLSAGSGYGAGGHGGDGGTGGGTGGKAGGESTKDEYQLFAGPTHLFNSFDHRWKERRFVFELAGFGSGESYIEDVIGGGSGGGGGGGGGRAGGNSTGGMGGGGAAGAGCVVVAARNIVIGPNGRISANGGNGANGAAGVLGTGTGAGGGGGGGGAGGGLVYLIYETLENNGSIEANGGSGGAGGQGFGTHPDGTAGADGDPGVITLLNMTTGHFES